MNELIREMNDRTLVEAHEAMRKAIVIWKQLLQIHHVGVDLDALYQDNVELLREIEKEIDVRARDVMRFS